MKTLIFLICFLPCSIFAQSDSAVSHFKVPRGPFAPGMQLFSAGFGMLTPDFLFNGYHIGKPVTRDYENLSPRLTYFLGYTYCIDARNFIGFTATYEQQYGNWLYNEVLDWDYDLKTEVKGAFVRSCVTAAFEFTHTYTTNRLVNFYLNCGAGITYYNETDQYTPEFYRQYYENGVNSLGAIRQNKTQAHFNGGLYPLCWIIGNKLSYFGEVGFGYKGVIASGITYKL